MALVMDEYSIPLKILDQINIIDIPARMSGMMYCNAGMMEFWNSPIEFTHKTFVKHNDAASLFSRFIDSIEFFE